jgi:hypothetical protein
MRINGLRERAREVAEVFVIPKISNLGGTRDTDVRQRN